MSALLNSAFRTLERFGRPCKDFAGRQQQFAALNGRNGSSRNSSVRCGARDGGRGGGWRHPVLHAFEDETEQ